MSTTRKALFTLAALGLAVMTAHPASAQSLVTGTITGLFNTGVDSTNMVLPNDTSNDPHYALTGVPDGSTKSTIVRTGNGFPLNYYLGDSSTSAWIGPDNKTFGDDLAGPAGMYDYQTTFTVSGLDPGFVGSASINGNWATDNTGTDILINGVSTGIMSSGFSAYTPFTINATGLKNGTNTIDFLVNNAPYTSDNNPTALRVDGLSASGVTASAAPEPAQIGMLAMVALGLGALAVKARKRSTAAQTA